MTRIWKEEKQEKRNIRQWIVSQTKNTKTSSLFYFVNFAQQINSWNLSFDNNDEFTFTFSIISKHMKISFMLNIPASGKRGRHSNVQYIWGLIPWLTGLPATTDWLPGLRTSLTSTLIYPGHLVNMCKASDTTIVKNCVRKNDWALRQFVNVNVNVQM